MTTPIEKKYIENHSKSQQKFKDAMNLFPNGVTHDARITKPFPYYISNAQGSKKWDIDGNEYIDYKSGHGAMLLGHAHPEIVQVVRFTSSGTEADMMGMRIMRAYTGKNKIVKFEHHFHGWSDGASATGGADENWEYGIPNQVLDTMIVIPPNDISILESLLDKDNDIAGVMLEPTGAHMGQYPIKPSFLKELRQLCTDRKIVLMFDEVVTGFRVAKGGAEELFGIKPDISSWAKILGGAAAGAKALEIVRTTNVNEIAAKRGEQLVSGLNGVLSKLEIPGLAYGNDSLVHFRLGIEANSIEDIINLSKEDESKSYGGEIHSQLGLSLINQGIDTWAASRFIMMAEHSEEDVNQTVEAMENAFIEARNQGTI